MFTTSCFVRIDDEDKRKEVIEFLEKVGYKAGYKWNSISNVLFAVLGTYCQDEIRVIDKYKQIYDAIDCGTNIDLFKALSALNDENDYMQLFTNGEEFILCDREDWYDMYSTLCVNGYTQEELDLCHKATESELIEHFNN